MAKALLMLCNRLYADSCAVTAQESAPNLLHSIKRTLSMARSHDIILLIQVEEENIS